VGRLLLRIAIGLVVGVILVGFFAGLGDRLILFPSTHRIPVERATRVALSLPEGRTAEAWVVPARVGIARRYVLRFYGNADRVENWIDREAAGWPDDVEACVNYPGYGTSGGAASLHGVADAAIAAYDAIVARAPGAVIYAFGTSLGTTAALHVAAERTVAGLVLTNPPPLRELIVGEHGWWNLWLLAYPVALRIPAELDSVSNARRVKTTAVFVLSQQDEVVPHAYHLKIVAAYAGPHEVLIRSKAAHNDPLAGVEGAWYADAVARLFARTPS
jgi:hypothetical protein